MRHLAGLGDVEAWSDQLPTIRGQAPSGARLQPVEIKACGSAAAVAQAQGLGRVHSRLLEFRFERHLADAPVLQFGPDAQLCRALLRHHAYRRERTVPVRKNELVGADP